MKFALGGVAAGLVAHVVAVFGIPVNAGVFGAPEAAASADPMLYVWAAVLTVIWSFGVAAMATPRHARIAILAYLAAWMLAGIVTIGVTWWWALSIAVVICAAAIGWSLGALLRQRRSSRARHLA